MAGYQKITIIGNLGKDPELKTLDSGKTVTSFPVAVTETYKNKQGEKISETEWFQVQFWGALADISNKYLKKGNTVHVECKQKTWSWDDQDGNKRYVTDYIGRELTMLGGNREGNVGNSTANQVASTQNSTGEQVASTVDPVEVEIDELPF